MQEQVARFTHTCFMVTPYEGYVEVCEALNRLTPGDHEKRSALFNSGAEAVENAVKIARAHTRRQAVVVFDHGYHGRTNLTMALTAKNMPYKHSFGPFAPEVYRVPMSYPFRDGEHRRRRRPRRARIDLIEKQVGADNVACRRHRADPGRGRLRRARARLPARAGASGAPHNGAVFVADEIQTGFCRTGDWFACDHEGVVPDLITTAKGIAGGLPLAAVTGRAEIMDAPHVGGLGGTYGGNPVACAAALGAIETMESLDLRGRARRDRRGDDGAAARAGRALRRHRRHPRPRRDGRRRARPARHPASPTPRPPAAVAKACHAEGLVVLTCGTYGNVLRFLPPLVMPDHLLDEGLTILDKAFAATA